MIIVVFLILLCRKIVICFFFEKGQKAKALNILSAVMLGLLVYGIFEPMLHQKIPFTSTFFFVAGLFISKYEMIKNKSVKYKKYESENYMEEQLE